MEHPVNQLKLINRFTNDWPEFNALLSNIPAFTEVSGEISQISTAVKDTESWAIAKGLKIKLTLKG